MPKKLIVFVLFQLFFQIFFYKGLTGPAIFFSTFAWNLVFFLTKKPNHSPLAYLASGYSLLLSLHTSLNPHHLLDGFNIVLIFLLNLYAWFIYRDETKSPVPSPIRAVIEPIKTKKFFSTNSILPLSLGLVFTIIIATILQGADSIFAKNTKIITDFFSQEFVARSTATLGISIPFLISTFIYFQKRKPNKSLDNLSKETLLLLTNSASWASMFLSPILGYFLYSSINYLTTKVDPNLPGFTYSAYVSQGFSQLIVVSILTLLTAQFSKNIFSKFLSLLTIALVGLNWHKLQLYISENGISQVRIFGAWFLLGLGIVLITQVLNKTQVIKTSLLTFFALFLLANLIDTDKLILLKNPPRVNGFVDQYYLVYNLKYKYSHKWPDIIAQSEQIILQTTKLPPQDISYDQYYQAYWSNQNLNSISGQIQDAVKQYGSVAQNIKLLESSKFAGYDYIQGDLRNLKEKNTFPTKYPNREWQYKSPYKHSLKIEELERYLYKTFELVKVWWDFESKIPDEKTSEFSTKVLDRKNY